MTPLSMACEDGMFSAALSLLEAGADATGESDGLVEGADPALRIYDQKPLELALLARSKQTDGRTAAVKERLIKRLVKSGADPNAMVCISARCNWTGPLLLKLIRARRRWEAEMLLSSGLLDIDQCDSHGATSLTWTLSTCHGDPVTASILLRRGAKMDEEVLCTVIDKLDILCVVFALLLGSIEKRRCGGNAISAGFAEVCRAYGYGDAEARDQSK
ncbi:ankyrin repeat protein [Colletotrichum incanum]|uniref:Ankyrin repeat protein n=1 Tax=Colletotrichum incanum TaxID=1573173 RepID=A0A162Q5J8_COLIC|nr:ankyrin repeat protein [Colletotrichum incanum]